MLQLCISARFPGATEPNYRGEDNSRLGQVMKQERVDNTCIPRVSSWVTSPGLNNSLSPWEGQRLPVGAWERQVEERWL